ncbi:hypothetical protein CDAR_81311 [Caerostris darwini]|uniref:Uncharacterized protein n=1 Tax=Caerostris darwini TaxID=1538125 RepID=A0AAV4MGL8_9ARAC|nr:hypothetical protein CDAR_81311 [Caerostris darwini]
MCNDMLKITVLLCHKIVTHIQTVDCACRRFPLLSYLFFSWQPFLVFLFLRQIVASPFLFSFYPKSTSRRLGKVLSYCSPLLANYSLATPTGVVLPSYYQGKDKICSPKRTESAIISQIVSLADKLQ